VSVVKSLSVGEGDMFYIQHLSDSFTIIDCCLNEGEEQRLTREIKSKSSGKGIKRFISTHPDDDHIRGLEYFDDEMSIVNFYCVRNEATKEDETDDFARYCSLRDSEKVYYLEQGCQRKWLNQSDSERGSAGIDILWPYTTNEAYQGALSEAKKGKNPNNISPVIKYTITKAASFIWMGDLENSFMESIKNELVLPEAAILFAPHHGRDSGRVPQKFLDQMNPRIIVIGEAPPRDLEYYPGYDTITQNSAGDIIFDCQGKKVHIYVGNGNYLVDFLADEHESSYPNYIGTLNLS